MRPSLSLFAALSAAALLPAPAVHAQQPTQATTQPPLPVLRVYANLIQIPVLVLSATRDKVYTPIAPDRFSLSFDNGPWVKAANAHLEADDPLDLAIVVDARRPQSDVLPTLDQAIARLAPGQLHPTDHVSIYVMSCGRVHSMQNVPADSAQLKSAAATALTEVTARRVTKDKSPCTDAAPLWDLLAYVTDGLSKAPGRRVILALTNGDDSKSSRPWNSLVSLAQNLGVTIFALNPDAISVTTNNLTSQPPVGYGPQGVPPPGARTSTSTQLMGGDLPAVSELTGGIMSHLTGNAYDSLKHAVEMVRDRYIIDFPRPTGATAGVHNLQVRIDRGNYFIRPAGDAVPAATPGQNDPTTIHPGNSTPVQLAADQPQPAAPVPPTPAPQPPTAAPTAAPAPPPPAAQTQQPTPLATAPTPATPSPATAPLSPGKPPANITPALKVTTRLTIVDVTVTDSNNHPIRGLLKPDFTIKEDGKPQALRDFAEYGNATIPAAAPAPLPPGAYTNRLPPAIGATNIILLDEVTTGLTDHLKIAPDNLMVAKKSTAAYLNSMPPGTQVAILVFGNGLHVVQDFTSDRNVLLSALKGVAFKPTVRTYHSVPMDGCDVANTQSRLQLEALHEIAAFAAGIKGRKNLVWFTPGTPWLTNYPLFSNVGCLSDFTAELKQTYGMLTAAQVALYPVDPRGLKTLGATAETTDVFNNDGRLLPNADVSGVQAQTSLNYDRASVADMAKATGGIAYTDRNDLDAALAEAITAGSDYYSISYTPPRLQEDHLYHSIQVSIDRPATRLQYSSGYNDGDLAALNPATKDAATIDPSYHPEMTYDALDSTQLTFNLRPDLAGPRPSNEPFLGAPNPALKNIPYSRYTFHYTYTPDQMTFTDDPDGGRHATIQFVLVAFDANGKPVNNLNQDLKLTFHPNQPEAALAQPFDSPIAFDVPGNTVTLRAGIFDLTAHKSGTINIPLTPPKP